SVLVPPTSHPSTPSLHDALPICLFGSPPPAQRRASDLRRASLRSQVGSWVHAPFFGFHRRRFHHAPVTGQDAALPVAFAAVAGMAFGRMGQVRPPLLAGDLHHHALQRVVGEISHSFSSSGSASIVNSSSISSSASSSRSSSPAGSSSSP